MSSNSNELGKAPPLEETFSLRRHMNYRNQKNEAKIEKMQQRRDAGSMAKRFPDVAGIIISMTYNQRGIKSILRTLNFSPDSYAFFKVDCLSRGCVDGGFDLTHIINAMIRDRRVEGKGALGCEGNDPSAAHSDIVYEVAIQYA